MARKYHYLRKNKGCSLPRDVLFIDTETDTEHIDSDRVLHTMKIGWTCYTRRSWRKSLQWSEEWEYWTDRGSLCQYIHHLALGTKCLNIICSNVVFDLASIGFFQTFPRYGYEYEFCFEKGMTFILSISKDKHRIKCMSIQNWYPESVDSLGSYIGLPKLEVDFEKSTTEELKAYCRRDTEILVRAFQKYIEFIKVHDLGNFKVSRASQSLTTFRHRFLTHDILFHAAEHVADLERLAYYGGRCEAFYIGDLPPGRYLYLDINSMYPYVMKTLPVPIRLKAYVERPFVLYIQDKVKKYGVVCEAELDTPDPMYAAKVDGFTCFPTGRFTAYLNTEGTRRALEAGHIKSIKRAALYNMEVVFRDYIDFFYTLRMKYRAAGDKLFDVTAKYFMNSLYGKFGQQKDTVTEKTPCDLNDLYRREVYHIDTGEHSIEQAIFGAFQRFQGKEDTTNTFTAVSAHVTEYGRFMLYDIIERIGRDRVLYCDTDSVIIPEPELDSVSDIFDPDTLGALKIEKETDRLTIHGPKDYEFGSDITMKGIKKTAEHLGGTTYRQSQWLSLNGLMREGITSGFMVKTVEKTLHRDYKKGVVTDTGRVNPLAL